MAPAAPGRLPAILAGAILVLGGLYGLAQLGVGEHVVTGSLPAKGPIVGVATILYVVSIGLGLAAAIGRLRFAALNLATAFAAIYALSWGWPPNLALAAVHAIAAALLLPSALPIGPELVSGRDR